MMFSSSTCRLVLLVSAACNVMTSADHTIVLGEAGNYAILAKSGISTVPSSSIYGNIAVSPIDTTAMTGFSLTLDSSGQFSTSTQVLASTGEVKHPGHAFAASYGGQAATDLTAAVNAMEAAYTDAAGRVNPDEDRINLGEGTLGGVKNPGAPDTPLTPGVYTFGTDVNLVGDVHFSGPGVYIIQMTGNLVQEGGYDVILGHGAKAENIFWQVAGHVEVGPGATMEGILLAKTKVDFLTGSSLNGRVLTQTACNLQKATITETDIQEMKDYFYLELETSDGVAPDEKDLSNAVELFVDSYNHLLETEYHDSSDRRMIAANVEAMTAGRRRLDHPQQESRGLQMTYLVFLRVSGRCYGCGRNPWFTNQTWGRNLRHRKLDENDSDDRTPGVPTEAAFLAAYSSGLVSHSGDYGSIVDAVSVTEVSEADEE
jgi:hypothetical protein